MLSGKNPCFISPRSPLVCRDNLLHSTALTVLAFPQDQDQWRQKGCRLPSFHRCRHTELPARRTDRLRKGKIGYPNERFCWLFSGRRSVVFSRVSTHCRWEKQGRHARPRLHRLGPRHRNRGRSHVLTHVQEMP